MNEAVKIPAGEAGFAATRKPTALASHTPGYIYTSPEIFRREKDEIFLKDWLCVARVEEFSQPGGYMTFRIFDEPIIVTRNAAGDLGAFANVCRHRGVEVASGHGNTSEFSCPYHGWLYDLDGRLVGAPYMKEAAGFDPASCRLDPVRLDTWAGWVFVNFDRAAMPLAEFVVELENDFSWLGHEDFPIAEKFEMEFDCNWKLIVENLLDFYHVATLHKETIGRRFDVLAMKLNNKPEGRFSCFYERESPMAGGQPLLDPLPALQGKSAKINSIGFLPPNFNIVFRPDYARPFIIWPLTPTRCKLVGYELFPREAFDKPGFAEAARTYHQLHMATLVEDIELVESLQNSCDSRNFVPGRMSQIEGTVHNTITWYLDRMFGAGS
jgi:phenylpropionate dioxygenase-like ring-hydroxylating dioxygenase large terminal subunit